MFNGRLAALAIVTALTGWALCPATAQDVRQFELPLVPRGPELVGDMSCPNWAQGATLEDFQLLRGAGTPAAPTQARVLADERHLYVGFTCHEPEMDKLVTEITQHGGSVWTDDCVEVMVDPTNAGAFHHHFIVNSAGVIFQAFHSSIGALPRPEGEITVATALGDGRWTCEVRIPFSLLGATPRPGEVWGMNVGRERQAGQAEVSSWQEATSFTDPTQLGAALVPAPEGPVQLSVQSRGGASALFNERGHNVLAVNVHNTGATEVPVTLLVVTDDTPISTREATVGPGAERLIRAPYEVPADAAGRIFFRTLVDGRLVHETSLQALQAAHAPARTWIVEDPLFEELLGDEPPGLARDGALMWTHAFNGGLLRETAKRFAVRYVLEEAYREFGEVGLIPVGGGRATGEREEMYERYGIGNLAYLRALPEGVPWVLDPRAIEHYFTLIEDLVANPHPHLWGIFAGDEVDCIAIGQGVRLKADPPEDYDYIHQADEEVRTQFGGGQWGIPEGTDDRNPYRWIAYHKWALSRLRERHRGLHEIVKRHNPDLPIVGTDPTSGVYGYEYSLQAPYFDIFTHQHMPRQTRWRQWLGFLSKMLADTTGKEVWPCAHVENYGMAPTPEEAVEELSQVLRNGGHGFHLYMPDTGNGNNIVGDTRVTMFGSPARHHTVMNVVRTTRTLPRLKYPEYDRAAIIYNDDCLQSSHRTTRTHWYLTEACYTFVGPLARSWFRFIDAPQVLNLPSLREAFDVIYLPTAVYQQPEIVSRLREFVEAGGTLICGDPTAFSTDTVGNDTSASRTALFGVEVGARIGPGPMTVTAGGREHVLSRYAPAHRLEVLGDATDVIGRFDTGDPAITSHRLGEGRAILFSANPFQFRANEDPAWQAFFTAWISDLGAPVGLDIWRFRYPDDVIWRPAGRTDYCLTNNNVEWREETPWFPRNLNTGGSYSYSVPPDSWADAVPEGAIPFDSGKLTDRRTSINAEKTEARWYAPYRLPASHWVARWQDAAPVSVTFDLGEPYLPTEVNLWFSESLPAVQVQGSADGETWHDLGAADGQEAGPDVLDLSIPLARGQAARYVRLNLGAREEDRPMSLVQAEVWGRQPARGGN